MAHGKGRGSGTGKDRTVYHRAGDDKWVEKRNDASKGSVHDTQRNATRAAKERLQNSGGGELIIKGQDGKIRSKDTIDRPDPIPPRDKEH